MLPRTPRPAAALLAALLLLPEPALFAAGLSALRMKGPGRLGTAYAPVSPSGPLARLDARLLRLGPGFQATAPRGDGPAAVFLTTPREAVVDPVLGVLRADALELSAQVRAAPGELLSVGARGLFDEGRFPADLGGGTSAPYGAVGRFPRVRSVGAGSGRTGPSFSLSRRTPRSGDDRVLRGLERRAAATKPARRFWASAARLTGLRALWDACRGGVLVQRYAARLADQSAPASERAAAARLLSALARRETIASLGYASAHDPDPRVRRAALAALIRLGREWLPRLTRELRLHPAAGRRLSAARDLAWLARSSSDPALLQALVDAAALDQSEDVRLTAVAALETARDAEAFARLEWLSRRESSPRVRSVLALALSRLAAGRLALLGRPVFYQPPAGEFESTKQPLYAAALKKVLIVGTVFVSVELVGSFVVGSIALRADAMHMLADLAVTAGSLFSVWMARRPPTSRRTYGFLKSEAVMGLLSALAIGFMGVEMLTEAVPRLWAPVPFEGLTTVFLALAGLASNAVSTLILYRYRDDNLSLKGAFLHALTDAIGSIGIIAAGLLTMAFGWAIADPIITIGIVFLIGRTTWSLLKRSLNVLIDAVPPGVDLDAVESGLLEIGGVVAVHDLHVWSLNASQTVATATLYVQAGTDHEAALAAARALLLEKHGLGHATVQVEVLKK